MIQQVDPSNTIGIKRYSDDSIHNFPCGSVSSSHIFIRNFQHLFEFNSYFSILFPYHKPCSNSFINTSPESNVNTVTLVQIGILTCFVYSCSNGDIV